MRLSIAQQTDRVKCQVICPPVVIDAKGRLAGGKVHVCIGVFIMCLHSVGFFSHASLLFIDLTPFVGLVQLENVVSVPILSLDGMAIWA